MMRDGLIADDGPIPVAEEPFEIGDNPYLARDIILGRSSLMLPIVYVSKTHAGETILDGVDLAFKLGGVAHVAIERDRSFSFEVRDLTDGRNPYNGTLGLCVPRRGIVRRFYLSGRTPTPNEVLEEIISAVQKYTTGRRSVLAADWSEIQEKHASNLRVSLKDQADSVDEYIATFDEELKSKDDTIRERDDRIKALEAEIENLLGGSVHSLSEFIDSNSIRSLYSGEIGDRVLAIVREGMNDESNLSERTRAIGQAIVSHVSPTDGATRLVDMLKRAGNDTNGSTGRLERILADCGFSGIQDGKHLKMEPESNHVGLVSITMALTPSDHRSGKNAVREIRNALGLSDITSME